jgi:hypothetical protein
LLSIYEQDIKSVLDKPYDQLVKEIEALTQKKLQNEIEYSDQIDLMGSHATKLASALRTVGTHSPHCSLSILLTSLTGVRDI